MTGHFKESLPRLEYSSLGPLARKEHFKNQPLITWGLSEFPNAKTSE